MNLEQANKVVEEELRLHGWEWHLDSRNRHFWRKGQLEFDIDFQRFEMMIHTENPRKVLKFFYDDGESFQVEAILAYIRELG